MTGPLLAFPFSLSLTLTHSLGTRFHWKRHEEEEEERNCRHKNLCSAATGWPNGDLDLLACLFHEAFVQSNKKQKKIGGYKNINGKRIGNKFCDRLACPIS